MTLRRSGYVGRIDADRDFHEEFADRLASQDWSQIESDVASAELVDPQRMGDWDKVAAEYPKSGPPGISYFRGVRADGHQVNCLLHREADGELTGILTHHPTAIPGKERAGQGNLWVHPDYRRRGIARALIAERWRRDWPVDRENMRMTPDGAQFVKGMLEEFRPDSPDVES